jgi:hypothetical protein
MRQGGFRDSRRRLDEAVPALPRRSGVPCKLSGKANQAAIHFRHSSAYRPCGERVRLWTAALQVTLGTFEVTRCVETAQESLGDLRRHVWWSAETQQVAHIPRQRHVVPAARLANARRLLRPHDLGQGRLPPGDRAVGLPGSPGVPPRSEATDSKCTVPLTWPPDLPRDAVTAGTRTGRMARPDGEGSAEAAPDDHGPRVFAGPAGGSRNAAGARVRCDASLLPPPSTPTGDGP